jgi:hypothetical protein
MCRSLRAKSHPKRSSRLPALSLAEINAALEIR